MGGLAAGLCGLMVLAGDREKTGEAPASQRAVHSPVAPEQSLALFQLEPGLRIELAAAEPEVIDPIAIAFDEDGRMWVVEMTDYPNGPAENEPPKSRLRVLEDRDGDGRFEHSHVFAERLLFATGVQPWRGGAIVTLAGRVVWMKDADGDGRADVEETWFSGFAEQNSQLRANDPTFALDNHIYIANGLRGGNVVPQKKDWNQPAQPISISGRDFRFNPTSGAAEAVSGVGQFGLTFDDFGNRFVCSNRNPCQHVVLEDRYLRRNPDLAAGAVMHDVSPAAEASRIFPISRAWTTSTLHAGQFTAACGVTIFRGDGLTDAHRGNSFTCDPTGNLVHRDVLEADGATFRAHPAREGAEFLASPDEWFRPVNMAHGPDGALYVVDMYRAVIEHPEWVPDELKHRPDERYGDDRGRIYRIVAEGNDAADAARRAPRLSRASTDELVRLLEHPNSWQRETAARLLYERQDRAAVSALETLARSGRSAAARVHALWGLQGLNALTDDLLLYVLTSDPDPRVREQGVRLSEDRLAKNDALRRAVLDMPAEARDARLDFQRALSLGEIAGDREARAALAMLALDRAGDPWFRKAAASSAGADASLLLERLVNALTVRQNWSDPGVAEFFEETAAVVGSQQREGRVRAALDDLGFVILYYGVKSRPVVDVLFHSIRGLGSGLQRRGRGLADDLPPAKSESRALVDALFARAVQIVASPDEDPAFRREAASVLRYAPTPLWFEPLRKLAVGEPDQSVRLAAIEALSAAGDPELGRLLVADFSAQTPVLRRAILSALLAREEGTILLLDEIEAERIRASELDAVRWDQLAKHKNAEIREKAARLHRAATPEDRQKVLAEYQRALALPADPARGRAVFAKNCTGCHRVGDLGVNVAPVAHGHSRPEPRHRQQLLQLLGGAARRADSHGNHRGGNVVVDHAAAAGEQDARAVAARHRRDSLQRRVADAGGAREGDQRRADGRPDLVSQELALSRRKRAGPDQRLAKFK